MQKLAQDHASPLPAVIFAAKSTDEDNGSVETQLAQCEAAAIAGGGVVRGSYEDRGQSGYRKNRGPELAKAPAHAERLAGEVGSCQLWVQHSDRLSRGDGKQAKHLLHYALRGLETNVVFKSLQDPQTFGDLLHTAIMGQRNHEDSHRKSMAARSAGSRTARPSGRPFTTATGSRFYSTRRATRLWGRPVRSTSGSSAGSARRSWSESST